MQVVATLLGLMAAVVVLALLARRVGVPYPSVMVATGAAASFIPHLPPTPFNPHHVMLLFLPPLLYSSAWAMPWQEFRENMRPILLMAIGFVIFTTCAVAGVMHLLLNDLPWAAALAFGAVISPTDPVAASSVTGRLGVPRRVTAILEGESLLNDASGLTIFQLAIGAAVAGNFAPASGALHVLRIIGGGVGIGLIAGWLAVWVHGRLDDPLSETAITLLAPYAAFLPAEAAGASGILATVSMGLYVGHRSIRVFSPRLRLRSRAVWNTITFLLNGFLFVLIGLQFKGILFGLSRFTALQLSGYVALVCAVVATARLVWIFPAAYLPWLVGIDKARPSWRRVLLEGYVGMRGVISLIAILTIPVELASGKPFPNRELLIFLTFMLILVTLVVQGATLPIVVRALGLAGSHGPDCREYEARARALEAGLRRLDELRREPDTPAAQLDRLSDYYQDRLKSVRRALGDGEGCKAIDDRSRRIRRDLLDAQRNELFDLYDSRKIDERILDHVLTELDLETVRLQGGDDQE